MVRSSESWQRSIHKITAVFPKMSGEAVLGTNFKRYAREQNQVKSDIYVGKEAKVHLSKLTEFLSLIGKKKQKQKTPPPGSLPGLNPKNSIDTHRFHSI